MAGLVSSFFVALYPLLLNRALGKVPSHPLSPLASVGARYPCSARCRGTSFIRNSQAPEDHHRTLVWRGW